MAIKNLTIKTKILLALALTFTVLLVSTALYLGSNQRHLVTELAEEKVDDIANTYFDGVNTMMLTGTTAQRGILKQKLIGEPGIVDVTILRAPAIIDTFGNGIDGELPVSAEDRRAINGEQLMIMEDTENGRQLTTWIPLKASSDYRGTNCLNCHPVPEGTVLGVAKAVYSLAAIDAKVARSIMTATLINVVMFIAGILVMVWLLHNLLVKPILQIRSTMHSIEQNADLATRLSVDSEDELGMLSTAINNMLDKFQSSIKSVAQTAHQVTQSAKQISEVSEVTYNAAFSQLTETNNIATAVNELSASAAEVNNNATRTADASVSADSETGKGAQMTANAVSGIHRLISEIEQAASVINQLDQRTQGIGHVLEVIRGIAEQTNLLALNAAIEAARAGESGRGFAVVADEVRTLATRSHQATEEIQQLVEKLQSDAKNAVQTMTNARESASVQGEQIENTGSSLQSIASQVTEIRQLNNLMANAANEQSTVTEDVSRNITAISQIAQDTSTDAKKVNDASHELVKLSAQLSQLVDQFKV
jgi:methyl-accepting chemotaxis protein